MADALKYAKYNLGANKAIIAIIPEIFLDQKHQISSKECSMYGLKGACGDNVTWWHHNNLDNSSLISFAKSKYKYGIFPALENFYLSFKTVLRDFVH